MLMEAAVIDGVRDEALKIIKHLLSEAYKNLNKSLKNYLYR